MNFQKEHHSFGSAIQTKLATTILANYGNPVDIEKK